MKPETKKAAKARMIAEKIAAAESAKAKYRQETFSHPVAIAIEPLRLAAVKQAEIDGHAYVKRVEDALEKHGYDLNSIAPYPRNNMGREEYRKAQNKRAAIESLTKLSDPAKMRDWRHTTPEIVEICPERVARYIVMTKEMAEGQYEMFVYKLVRKIKEQTSHYAVLYATLNNEALENDTLWHLSLLTVTRADGSVEKWRTRMIFNTSIYGKVFPQWPTRIVK